MLRNYLLNYLCDYLDDVILVELLLPVFGYGDKHNCLVGLAFDITWSVIIKTHSESIQSTKDRFGAVYTDTCIRIHLFQINTCNLCIDMYSF